MSLAKAAGPAAARDRRRRRGPAGAGPAAARSAAAEVSGPGFINITLRDGWLAGQADRPARRRRGWACRWPSPPQRVVVDYSGPNVAKELHAGHLRATVVGDAIVRVLEFLGHTRDPGSHLGDWGTQFGMLIEHALDVGEQATPSSSRPASSPPSTRPPGPSSTLTRSSPTGPGSGSCSSRRATPQTLRLWQMLVERLDGVPARRLRAAAASR